MTNQSPELSVASEADAACQAEYDRLQAVTPPVKISRWSPRTTQRRGEEREQRILSAVERFHRQWWRSRGFGIEEAADGSGFMVIAARGVPPHLLGTDR